MKYNLRLKPDILEAKLYLDRLIERESKIELKKINPKRSLSQNSYLHLLLGAFGNHFGYTLEEAKQIYKLINRSIYFYEKENRGKKLDFIRSSASLTVEEMNTTIEKFRVVSAEQGYPLPLPTDQGWLDRIDNEIQASRHL